MREAIRLRATMAALWLIALAALACILLSLDRGLELTDESAYIYLLHHRELVMQFVDHRLWGVLNGSVACYRALPLVLAVASAVFVATGATRALAIDRQEALLVHATTLVGALGWFAVIRPTMNYGATGLFFGNIFVGLLLHDLARPAGWRGLLPLLLGTVLALLALGRFTAVPAYLVLLIIHAALRAESERSRLWLVGATLAAGMAATAVLIAFGVPMGEMVGLGASLTSSSHRLGAFVPRDLALIALMAGVGAAGAGVATLAARVGVPRSLTVTVIVAAVLVAAVVDQRAVIFAPDPGAPPFALNVNLYGTTYAFYVVAGLLAGLLLLDDLAVGRAAWGRSARMWGVLLVLAFACAAPFLGTNTGILARSGLNAGPLFAGIAVAALSCARRGLTSGGTAGATMVGVAALGAFWVFFNTIWSPYGINGSWARQTERLEAPAALRGLRVSPGTARLASDLREGMARLGFDPTRDRLLFGYGRPGLALLAGGDVAGLPFAGDDPAAAPLLCAQIARAVASDRPRRLYGLNLDYRPELVRCLAGRGIDLTQARRYRISSLVTITALPIK